MNEQSIKPEFKSFFPHPSPFIALKILGRVLGNVFVALTGAYGLNLTLFLLLRLLVGERWTFMAIFNSVLHLLLIPPLALLPLCLLLRRRRLALTLVPPVGVFFMSYAAFFIPLSLRSPQVASNAPQLSILTFNLKFQERGLEEAVAIIRSADADVVALQELSEAAASILDAEFAAQYPYRAFHPIPGEPILGQGIMSRYPLLSDEYWRIHLGHQRVTIALENTALTLYNAHPIQPLVRDGFARRAEEITVILERAANDSGPLILAGDFNMSDQSEDYQRLTESYTDAYRVAGWGLGFTFPDFTYAEAVPDVLPPASMPVRPVMRLDYIFYNSAFQALEARVLSSSGDSDHRPVFARLALR